MNRTLSLILFLALVLGGGLVLGFLTTPGEWYAGLAKPSFNPPAWLFGPVWTVLYILIAVTGWRTWQCERGGLPMKMWWAQLVLNFLWTPVFFAAHQIGLAFVVILLMLAAILAFIINTWRLDRVAAWLFAPYAAWVAFASLLERLDLDVELRWRRPEQPMQSIDDRSGRVDPNRLRFGHSGGGRASNSLLLSAM